MRFGAGGLAPLAELESPESAAFLLVDAHDAGRGWGELLEFAPDLAATAAAYLHAQWLLGAGLDLPAGVRRALAQPHKRCASWPFLSRCWSASLGAPIWLRAAPACVCAWPIRGGCWRPPATRCASVWRRPLADALFAAAEQQTQECYRRRLVAVAGPLPSDLRLDDDLLNAALLTLDVQHNRRLLLRLLRAHLSGEHGWREQHPANIAFLHDLAAHKLRYRRLAGHDAARLPLRRRGGRARAPASGARPAADSPDGQPDGHLPLVWRRQLVLYGCERQRAQQARDLCHRYERADRGPQAGRDQPGVEAWSASIPIARLATRPATLRCARSFGAMRPASPPAAGWNWPIRAQSRALFAEAWYDDGVVPLGRGGRGRRRSAYASLAEV